MPADLQASIEETQTANGKLDISEKAAQALAQAEKAASQDAQINEKLAAEHKCPRLILEYRSLVKLKNTYLDNLTDYVNPKTNRIHASFNQTGAATGRLSCSDPNLQNIPIRTDEGRRIRLAFVAGGPDKVLLTADYSQIELRVLAHFTEEPALLRAFALLLEDLLFLNSGTPELLRNIDLRPELDRLAPTLSFQWIEQATRGLDQVYSGMRRNLLRSLSLDSFATQLAEAASR